jgi:hypothetical protein
MGTTMTRILMIFIFFVNVFFHSILIAEEKPVQSKNESEFERFIKLSSDNQKKILAEVFEKRVNFAKNLFYRNEVHTRLYKYDNGKVGDFIANSNSRRDYAYWQLNNDYRYDINFFDPSRSEALQWSTCCWDSKEGIQKSTVKNESIDRTFARIDTVYEKAIIFNDTYSFWLQNGSSEEYPKPYYLFPYLLDHLDLWNLVVPFEENKIQLTISFIPKSKVASITGEGEIMLVLDPEKHFMPVRGHIQGNMIFPDGKTPWWEDVFTVKESKFFDSIWMPIVLETRTSYSISKTIKPEKFSISTITIKEMEQGKVTKGDVTMKFPESTEVTDAINGISYKTDVNGNPIESTIQPLYGLDPSKVKLPEKKHSKTANYALIVTGLLLIVIALYLMFKKNKKAS